MLKGWCMLPRKRLLFYEIVLMTRRGQDYFFYGVSYMAKISYEVLGPRHSFGSSRRGP